MAKLMHPIYHTAHVDTQLLALGIASNSNHTSIPSKHLHPTYVLLSPTYSTYVNHNIW